MLLPQRCVKVGKVGTGDRRRLWRWEHEDKSVLNLQEKALECVHGVGESELEAALPAGGSSCTSCPAGTYYGFTGAARCSALGHSKLEKKSDFKRNY